MDVIQNIRDKYPGMTKKQKDIADRMLADPERMSFITLKELSADVHVSEMTILNACSYLGYANFNELKYEFRKYLLDSRKLIVQQENGYASPFIPQRDLDNPEDFLMQICQEEMAMLHNFYSQIDPAAYFEAADLMLNRRFVILCGRGVSLQAAEFMSIRLSLLGIPSMIVNTELNDSIQAVLPLIREGTLLVAFSFPDYYFMTTTLVQYAKQKGADILGVTDTPRSDIAPLCNANLYASTGTRLFLNTISSVLMLVNTLTSAVSIAQSADGEYMNIVAQDFSAFFQPDQPSRHVSSQAGFSGS